jgi:hypothetical protein
MKVAVTTVGSKGPPEDETQNGNRINAGNQAIEIAKSKDADLLILPAGFLFHTDSKSRHEIAYALIDRARRLRLAAVFGVDGKDDDNNRAQAYGYAWSPAESIIHCWKQRSFNGRDQWGISQQLCDEVRLLRLDCGFVGVLLCGEIFNERIRNALSNKKPEIVVDLVHRGSGFRSTHAMKKLCHDGIASACSAHVKRDNAMKRCYIPGEGSDGDVSTRDYDRITKGPPRIELKLFEIP